MPAASLAIVSGFLGSNNTLLFGLRNRSEQLSDLEKHFRILVDDQQGRRKKLEIVSFCEMMPTRVLGLFSTGLVSASALYLNIAYTLTLFKTVDASSAQGYTSKIHQVEVSHVDLNKSPKVYATLTKVLHDLKSYTVMASGGYPASCLPSRTLHVL